MFKLIKSSLVKVLLAVFVVSSFATLVSTKRVFAGGPITLYCDFVRFEGAGFDPSSQKNLIRLPIRNDGNIVSQDVQVTIQMSGSLANSDFELTSYRFAYVQDRDKTGSWNYVEGSDLNFTEISPGVFQATFKIRIDAFNDWVYSLEATGSSGTPYHTSANDSNGTCGAAKTDTVTLGVAPANMDQDFAANCGVVGSYAGANHFECQKDPSTNAYSFNGNSYCQSEYEIDFDRCVSGQGLTEGVHCLLCKSPTAAEPTRVNYGEVCDLEANIMCNLQPGLACGPSYLPDETGVSRCYYSGNYRRVGESCFVRANECVINDMDRDGSPVYCAVTTPGSAVGICTRLFDGIACETDLQCERELGTGAKCEQGFCLPGYATEQENPAIDPLPTDPDDDPSTDFGPRNCPFAEPICVASAACTDDSATCKGLARSCAADPSGGRFKSDPNSSLSRNEQLQQFRLCTWCIRDDGGTWTEAFGCIVTSPEGVFTALIRISLGVMGGVALLRITYLGIITAQSKDEGKIAEARKGVIATLGGIAIVILSVLILRVIGVNVLDVVPPGFF